jgi:tRNA (guanine-N7-)-methyltransferase
MSGKKKLKQFAENATFKHVIEPSTGSIVNKNEGFRLVDHELKGRWNELVFQNNNPITLELACGKGEYTVGMARHFPHRNFIGIDIKGARIWSGAKIIEEEKLSNAVFLRTRIDFITSFFANDEVSEIWITFTDPQPQKNRAKKRLTSPVFIARYKEFLIKEGRINLKTDNEFFFNYTLEEIEKNSYPLHYFSHRVYEDMASLPKDDLKTLMEIKTHYELLFAAKGHPIQFLQFSLTE